MKNFLSLLFLAQLFCVTNFCLYTVQPALLPPSSPEKEKSQKSKHINFQEQFMRLVERIKNSYAAELKDARKAESFITHIKWAHKAFMIFAKNYQNELLIWLDVPKESFSDKDKSNQDVNNQVSTLVLAKLIDELLTFQDLPAYTQKVLSCLNNNITGMLLLNEKNQNILMQAILFDHKQIMADLCSLLKKNPDQAEQILTQQDSEGYTPLYSAIDTNQPDIIHQLLIATTNPRPLLTQEHDNALMVCLEKKNLHMAQLICSFAKNISSEFLLQLFTQVDADNSNIFMLAAEHNEQKFLEYFLDLLHDAPEIRRQIFLHNDRKGSNALALALLFNQEATVTYLLDYLLENDQNLLFLVIHQQNYRCYRLTQNKPALREKIVQSLIFIIDFAKAKLRAAAPAA